jgi:hypothetical protein
MILASHGIIASSGVSQFDTDALSFITAASISDLTQQTAINTLVTDLKTYNIWTKMKAIYPFVGGSSSSHKWNLKDPRDLDAAYRLTFFGGITHDADGFTGNGTTGYALTYLPASTMAQNSIHMSWRSNTDVGGTVKAEIGQVSFSNLVGYSINGAGTAYVTRLNSASSNTVSTTTSNGFYQASRLSSANYIMQKDGTQSTVTSTSNAPTPQNIIIGASSNGADFSNRNIQLVTLGDGLTATEMNALRTAENNYKATLGR